MLVEASVSCRFWANMYFKKPTISVRVYYSIMTWSVPLSYNMLINKLETSIRVWKEFGKKFFFLVWRYMQFDSSSVAFYSISLQCLLIILQ